MAWDFSFASWIRKKARIYTDSVALHGVPVNYPQVDPTTQHWRIFDPTIPGWIDTGIVARGASPRINLGTGTWEVWNDATAQYVDSTVKAQGPQGETPEFRTQGNVLQYRFATIQPTAWTELYTFIPPVYEHNQTAPATVWMIQHNLGGAPITAFTVDDAGEQIVGQVDTQTSTSNLLVLRFSEPLTGRAYVKL